MNNGNQPAFAYDEEYHYHQNGEGLAHITKMGGLTKREYFAVMAMQGMLSSMNGFDAADGFVEHVAKSAIKQADALLKELDKTT